MVKKAVIIAAGEGSRLKNGRGVPKPLAKVAGVGLLKRTILSAQRAGIHEFVIVTGYCGKEIQHAISSDRQIDVEIDWVHNNAWEQGNGLSVLKAREYVDESFLLLMSDHLFDPQILVKLRNTPVVQGEVVLCVDSQLDDVFDIDDATKVNVDGDRVAGIAKDLDHFNAVDTGLFLCHTSLFEALDHSISLGDGSLSGGIRKLADDGSMRTVNIDGLFWMDVDTPESLIYAEKTLFEMLGKSTDGPVSRHFNRKISRRITSLLVRTPVTPNQISIAAMCITFLAAWLLCSPGDYWSLAMSGLLFQFASIVDGCDGEIANLKFKGSQTGEWVDTIADNVSYFVFFLSIPYGMYQTTKESYILTLGYGTLVVIVLAMSMIFLYLKHVGSGSIVSFFLAFSREVPEDQQGWHYRVSSYLKPWSRRDMFTALFCVLALINSIEGIYWVFIFGSLFICATIFVYAGHLMQTGGAWAATVSVSVDGEKLVSEKAD